MKSNYEIVCDTANLLDAMARYQAQRTVKNDPLIARYNALIPRIRIVTDYDSVLNFATQQLQKPLNWKPNKDERKAIKEGTYVLDMNPRPQLPRVDSRELIGELFRLLADFPPIAKFAEQRATVMGLRKGRKNG